MGWYVVRNFLSTSASDFLTIADADVAALKLVVDLLLWSAVSFREVTIHSDSRAAK